MVSGVLSFYVSFFAFVDFKGSSIHIVFYLLSWLFVTVFIYKCGYFCT